MNHYFPAKLFKSYGFRAVFFIISTLPLYLIHDVLRMVLKDPVKIWRLRLYIPIILFTPSTHVLISLLDFSVLAFLQDIYVWGTYGKLIDYEPKRGWVVVDAGAYFGLYMLYVADRDPKLVIAMEPDPRNFKRLTTTLRINRLRNIMAIPYALAGENGYHNFLLSNDAFTSGVTRYAGGYKTIKVRGVSLLTLMHTFKLNYIDLLKLDVEGAEYGITSSSDEVLREGRVRRIVGEIHGKQREIDEFVKHLEGLGFKIEYLLRFTQTALIHAKYFGLGQGNECARTLTHTRYS